MKFSTIDQTIKKVIFPLHFLLLFSPIASTLANTEFPAISDEKLLDMDFEELMTLKVSSVNKKTQNISELAAAITVISQEDIRRSGATAVAELMRMVPGFIVTRIDANKWSVSSSEDSNRISDDMTVLIDGRPTYSPLFGGTFWEHIDVVLQDIERIEVIRGPSGKMWGSNMNRGAVNIITKSAKDTHGFLVSAGGGTEERGQAVIRYGGQIGKDFNYRIYGKANERDASWNQDTVDDWRNGQAGFRADWQLTPKDNFTVQGNYYAADSGQRLQTPNLPALDSTRTFTEDARYINRYLSTAWQHQFTADSAVQVHLYYDNTERKELSLNERRDNYGVDLSHSFALPWNQKILWGFTYRNSNDHTEPGRIFALDPADRTLETVIGYVQDEIGFFDDKLRVAIGGSLVDFSYTEPLFQPNLRVAWMPSHSHTLWAAVTRSFRTPYRLEREGSHYLQDTDNPDNGEWLRLLGNPRQQSEESTGYQIGYRGQINSKLSMDVTGLFITERSSPTQTLSADNESAMFENRGGENIYGLQASIDWRPFTWWMLKPTASYMKIEEIESAGENGPNNSAQKELSEDPEFLAETGWPTYQASLRSLMNIGEKWEFDTTFRYVDQLKGSSVKSYINLDVRLGWHPMKQLEFSLIGHNLLQNHHQEAIPSLAPTQTSEIQRGVYGWMTWRY